jgi:hypothetical protein
MGVNGIIVKQFFSKMIVEKNKAMAVFQSIYGNYIWLTHWEREEECLRIEKLRVPKGIQNR